MYADQNAQATMDEAENIKKHRDKINKHDNPDTWNALNLQYLDKLKDALDARSKVQ
jgi:hypothetical protein